MMTADGEGVTYPASSTYAWPKDAEIDLLAVPEEDWQFVRWESNGSKISDEAATTITLANDKDIQAIFTPEEFVLYASPSMLTGVSYILGEGPSESREVSLMGKDLEPGEGEITITGSEHFEISTDNESFSANLEIDYSGGELPSTTIFVRLQAGLQAGNYSHEEILVSGGGDQVTIVASGEVGATSLPYAQDFSGFVDEHSLPFGWQVSDYTYYGDWGTGTSAGLRGNDEVLGYQHTASTGTFVAELTLQHTGDQEIKHLYVSYLGRTHRSAGRSPEWEVRVNDQVAQTLWYSTIDEEDKTKSALLQLDEPVAPDEVFTLSWSSNRGEGSGSSRQIGIADVFISTFEDIPATASLHVEGDVTLDQSLAVENLTITGGNRLIVNPGTNLEVSGKLDNASARDDTTCGLIIRSDIESTGSLIHHSEDVMARMERHLPFGGSRFIAAPVSGMEILGSSFAPDTDPLPGHFDFYSFDEGEPYPWVNLQSSGASPNEDFDQHFKPAKGYLVAYFENEESAFPENPFTFKGTLHSGNINHDLNHSNTPEGIRGWNLVGNPYPSAIDWGAIDKSDLDNVFAYIYDGEAENYIPVENGSIAPHQGFFVKSKPGGGQLPFTDDIRQHEGTYTKTEDSPTEDRIVMEISRDGRTDRTTLRILENTGFTQGRRDAYKLFSFSEEMPQIFTITEDQQRLAIQSIPLVDPERQIPVGVLLPENGDYMFTIKEISGAMQNYTAWLKDNQTSELLALYPGKQYAFAGTEGELENRFALHFTHSDLDAADIDSDGTRIWHHDGHLYVNSSHHEGELRIYDVQGRLLQSHQLDEGLNDIAPGLRPGVYIAVINNADEIKSLRFIIQ